MGNPLSLSLVARKGYGKAMSKTQSAYFLHKLMSTGIDILYFLSFFSNILSDIAQSITQLRAHWASWSRPIAPRPSRKEKRDGMIRSRATVLQAGSRAQRPRPKSAPFGALPAARSTDPRVSRPTHRPIVRVVAARRPVTAPRGVKGERATKTVSRPRSSKQRP